MAAVHIRIVATLVRRARTTRIDRGRANGLPRRMVSRSHVNIIEEDGIPAAGAGKWPHCGHALMLQAIEQERALSPCRFCPSTGNLAFESFPWPS